MTRKKQKFLNFLVIRMTRKNNLLSTNHVVSVGVYFFSVIYYSRDVIRDKHPPYGVLFYILVGRYHAMDDVYFISIEFSRAQLENLGIKARWEWQKSLHCTLKYLGSAGPVEVKEACGHFDFGSEVIVHISGEGFFGNLNQGLFLELPETVECCNRQPHLTVSINAESGAKAVDTKHIVKTASLDLTIQGRVAWVDHNHVAHYEHPVV